MFSGSCQPAVQELHAGEEEPCLGAGDGCFEVLGQAAVAVEPGQGTFDHPTARYDFEALRGVRPLDDLQRPSAEPSQRVLEFRAAIGTIGEDVAQPREGVTDRSEHRRGAVAVQNVRAMDQGRDQQTAGVGEDMALAARDLLIPPAAISDSRGIPIWEFM